MKIIETTIKYFFYITTSILIVCAVVCGMYKYYQLPNTILFDILLSGIVTTVITVAFNLLGSLPKMPFVVNTLLHYICLCIVMILFGEHFGWLDYNVKGIAMMMVSVACVYAITFVFGYWMDDKKAKEINKRLQEKYKD